MASVNVFESVKSSFSSIINSDRQVKEEAIKLAEKQVNILLAQIETLQNELQGLSFTSAHEERINQVLAMLPASLSDQIKITTALQVLSEEAGKDLQVVFKEGKDAKNASLSSERTRESKEAFQERLLSAMADGNETTVKILSERLEKAVPQVNTLLNVLVQTGRVSARKGENTRTVFYRLK